MEDSGRLRAETEQHDVNAASESAASGPPGVPSLAYLGDALLTKPLPTDLRVVIYNGNADSTATPFTTK